MNHADITLGAYRVLAVPNGLPSLVEHYVERARLADRIELDRTEKTACFFAVGSPGLGWPDLVVMQTYDPSVAGFNPGILIAAEADTAFIGAGTRVLAYRLRPEPERLWVDACNFGFWGWAQFGDVVVMSAELELAAWTASGQKLWTMFVEPPWTYTVDGGTVRVDVMGTISEFPLTRGPG